MRALIFSVAYFPFVGGAEVAIKEITKRLPGIKFDLVTVNLDGKQPKQEQIGNVMVYRAGKGKWGKYLFPFLGFLKGSMLHRRYSYQTTWSMMANYAGFAALFFKIFHPRVKYVLTLQEGDPIPYIKKKVRLVYPIFRRIFTKADAIQVISNYLGDFAREMGGKNITVIPNGVDFSLFGREINDQEIDMLRKKLNLNPDKIYLITTSRLVVKNGLADVISALPLLSEDIHFLIIGDGPEKQNLYQLAQAQGVLDRTHFLGYKSYEELPVYLHLGQIFIRPSLSEGMGNSFIEAMAAGLPVIATPVGGILDFLHDGETGLFCQVGNPESIATAVKKYLANSELRQSVISKSKQLVVDKYQWDDIASKMRYNLLPL